MTVTTASVTFEFFWGHHFFFSGFGREMFIKFSTGLPFWFFSRERQGVTLELWGFGMSLVTHPS